MTRISLCMIVRDEEDHLERCLASAARVVDEICVIDTGSTDRTRAIAVAYGARVEAIDWQDDFAAARNASLALASGDWVLVLDADEQIANDDARALLERFAAAHPARAGHVTLIDRSQTLDDGRRTELTRFFPRAKRPSFAGSIHEQLLFDGRVPPRAPTQLEVLHFGYADDSLAKKGKLERNRRLLERALARAPQDAYLHFQLGRTHARAGDQEGAMAAFSRAFENVAADAPYLAGLVLATGNCLRALEQYEQAYALFTELGVDFADDPEMCFLGALLGMDVGNFELAELGFQRCLQMGAEPRSAASATTLGAAYNLGLVREFQDRPKDARDYYERALALAPDHAPSQAALARLSVGR